MVRLLKWVVYLVILAVLALAAYTYIGPFFGVDFTPQTEEVRQPVDLNVD